MFAYVKRSYPTCTAYSFTNYELEDFPDDWLFNLEHDDDWREWHGEQDRMYEDVLDDAIRNGCVGIWHPGSSIWYYLHTSAQAECMQLTCWDSSGPVGHAEIRSGADLAQEVYWNDFTTYKVA